MHIQYFSNLSSYRTLPLGISGKTIYIYVETDVFYEFYALDIRFPMNWHQIGRIDRFELSYAFPTLSPDARFIFVMFLKAASNGLVFGIQRFDLMNGAEDLFLMNTAEELYRVFEVPLDNIKVRCGPNHQLVIFDRTIVQGEIPFWIVRLDETAKTFVVLKNSIGTVGDDSETNSSLFTIGFDPANRCFAKLMGPRKMLVYTEERKKWVEYVIPPEDSLRDIFGTDGFPVEDNRGIRETFGTHGHRIGAMQTRLTFHDLEGSVVARVLHLNRMNTTALVELVHGKREIRVRKLAKFHLDDKVSRMFYLIASPEFHVFLGVRNSATVYIQSPSLEEIGGWKMQQMLLNNGFSEELCQISNYRQLLALCFAKYAVDKDEEVITENLKNLGIKKPKEKLVEMEIDLD